MMSDKFSRFTRQARHVLTLAQEEAVRLHHNYIGTEHLLLGLTREEEGTAARVLHGFQVDSNRLREVVREIAGEGRADPGTRLSLTPRMKRAIELAVEQARGMGMHYISPVHLLWGVLALPDSIAVSALHELGVTEDKVRERLLAEVSRSGVQTEEERPQLTVAATALTMDDKWLYCEFSDRRMIRVPLDWYPRLRDAPPEQRANHQIIEAGQILNWPDLRLSIAIAELMSPGGPTQESA